MRARTRANLLLLLLFDLSSLSLSLLPPAALPPYPRAVNGVSPESIFEARFLRDRISALADSPAYSLSRSLVPINVCSSVHLGSHRLMKLKFG